MLTTRRRWLTHACALPAAGLLGACASGTGPLADAEQSQNEQLARTREWAGWQERRFPSKRPTRYTLERDFLSGATWIRAQTHSSASMLQKRMDVPGDRLGDITFSWRAERVSEDADLSEIDASDAVVRVVLGFDGDRSRWSPRDSLLNELSRVVMGEDMPYATLVYAWCVESPTGTVVHNPRTATIRNLVLESGADRRHQWLDYQRDVRRDFQMVFGEPPGRLIGLGIMSDSDNTRSHSEGGYRDIRLDIKA